MTDRDGPKVLTDEQWGVLAPLIEASRPPYKTDHHDLRRTIEAILWRHDNGAKWRQIPADLGPWWRAAQTFGRWSRLGVWERLLEAARRHRGRDGVPRGHQHPSPPQGRRRGQKGGTSAERDAREGLGRSRGGYGTKACVMADASGRAIGFALAPGQAHELPLAPLLLTLLSLIPAWIVADRGYASQAFRDLIWQIGARPAIPAKRNEAPVACPPWIYVNRNRVERLWSRLKEWRAVAPRYEKTARCFMGVLCMAATMDWIK